MLNFFKRSAKPEQPSAGVPAPSAQLVREYSIARLKDDAELFRATFARAQEAIGSRDFGWYPYDSLSNFAVLDVILTDRFRDLGALAGSRPILDIGCADGATSFLLASKGFEVDTVDYPPTNFNGMRGVRALAEYFKTPVSIHSLDLDSQFSLPRSEYGLALFLGLLYHLKNPFYALEKLSYSARYCLLSTRVAKLDPSKAHVLENLPVGYLVGPEETNNDATNFWIFSKAGLARLVSRAGWKIECYGHFGNTTDSDPATAAGDERAFCLLSSQRTTT